MVGTGILSNNTRPPLPNVTRHSGWWPSSVTPSIYQVLHQFLTLLLIWTLLPNLTFYLIARSFHRTFATGAACQQRTLTPQDTLSCAIWDLHMFFCWDHWHSIIQFTSNSLLFAWFDFLPNLTPFLDLTPPFHVPIHGLTSYWIWHDWI